jgi:F-type H+-transporting ATPase subunit b
LAAAFLKGPVHLSVSPAGRRPSCETWRKGAASWIPAASLSVAFFLALPAAHAVAAASTAGAAAVQAQPTHEAPVKQAAAEGHAAEGEHGESIWATVGKVFNFAVLAAVLVYFLRQPLQTYLLNRGQQIRNDLVTAATMKEDAARQIASVDARLRELPAELDALRERGQQEIAAEQTRIEQAAAGERDRLLEQTRRAIDLHVRGARRELVNHAADLAVQVARQRIETQITDEDQRRLVDRYLERMEGGA